MKKVLLFFAIILANIAVLHAYDFSEISPSWHTLYYNIIGANKIAVTYPASGSNFWTGFSKPTGNVIIPSTVIYGGNTYVVEQIGDHAFEECYDITGITIPNGVVIIGKLSFYDCHSIHSVVFPNSLVEIDEKAFMYCESLYSISFSNNLKYIGKQAFENCGITSVNLPASVVRVYSSAFENNPISSININNPEIILDKEVFHNTSWYNNKSNGIIYIGTILYEYKGTPPQNYSITINSNTTSIACRAFYNKYYFRSITLPASLKIVGDEAFRGCEITTAFNVPSNLKYIGDYAFYGCRHFTTLTLSSTLNYIGANCFNDCWDLTTVNYNAVRGIYSGNNGAFTGCNSLSSLNIGQSVSAIPSYIFKNCNIITDVSLDGVDTIGDYSFYNCSELTTITIPSSVNYIGQCAFGNCSKLATIYYNAPNCNVNCITANQRPFLGCNQITTVYLGYLVQTIPDYMFYFCSNLTSINFPNSLTRIGIGNFYYCSLLTGTIMLPSSLTHIGANSFSNCLGISNIECYAITPPIVDPENGNYNIFSSLWNAVPLKVPCESVSLYQSAQGWSSFSNISGIGNCSYTVTVTANDPSMGSVSGGGTYNAGSSITITATPYSGYHFDHWSDGNTDNPRTIVVNGDVTLTAYFVQNAVQNYTVAVTANDPSMGMVTGGGTYAQGTSVTITATPYSGYHFDHWSDGNTDNPRTIVVNGDVTLMAYFGQNASQNYTVVVSTNDPSMGTVSGGGTYTQGTSVTITATPYSGYHFDHWSDGNTDNPRTIVVNGDVTLTAFFAQNSAQTYTVTLNTNNSSMGFVSGGGTYDAGTTITIIAFPHTGYHFDHWSDGNTDNPRTIIVNSNISLIAYFEQDAQYTVTLFANDSQMGFVIGGGSYTQGSSVTIRAIPYDGYQFFKWSDGNTLNPRTIVVNGNMTLTAYFRSYYNSIEDPDFSNPQIYSSNKEIIIKGFDNQSVMVYTIDGLVVAKYDKLDDNVTIQVPTEGIYIVRIGTNTVKKVVVR